MEAMSVESLLLSAWEEDGYVGKTRVPIGDSDIDVLAIQPGSNIVRFGETKVTEGSQKVSILDAANLALFEAEKSDIVEWLEAWSDWLRNLEVLWNSDGHAKVPWIPEAGQLGEVQVVFCASLQVLDEREKADAALKREVYKRLARNPLIKKQLEAGMQVNARLQSTVEVLMDLIESVCKRIDSGYGRRFGSPIKDVVREIHRYLTPQLSRIPKDENDKRRGQLKKPFADSIRKKTVLNLLKAFGVQEHELKEWLKDHN